MINEPAHILKSSSSCIDLLIFTSQPLLITESGAHSSLYPNSQHQIIFSKFNLEIFITPSYDQDTNTDLIRRAINMFDWEGVFVIPNVNEKVFILQETILNILSSFIPHEILIDRFKKSHPREKQC